LSSTRSFWVVACLAWLASACGTTPPPVAGADGGAVIDGGASLDGGAALDGGAPADGGAPDDGGVVADAGPLPETMHAVTMNGPSLAPGVEKTFCIVTRLSNAAAMLVRSIETTLSVGSHHLVVYRYQPGTSVGGDGGVAIRETPFECTPFVDVARFNAVPIMISQTRRESLELPAGVAYEMGEQQLVRIEAHYLNATTQPLNPVATINFRAVPLSANLQRADFLFFGTPDIDIRAGQTATVGPRFINQGFPAGANIFAMTTHTHRFGTQFKVQKSTSRTDPGTPLYEYDDWFWEEPPVRRFDTPLTFQPGEGVRFTCEYNNTSGGRVTFGESATEEMCFMWLYYYPSQGFKICVDTEQSGAGQVCCPGHFVCSLLPNFLGGQ
jgi:Copper type II ascorbate-dependent monooxygenase, C-terminal domain